MFPFRRLTVIGSVSCLLAGCSAFPSQGPTTLGVLEETYYQSEDYTPRYMVVPLDERVSSILERESLPSFQGKFGDRREATTAVIGVGDSVSVTVWEAASGGLFSSSGDTGHSAGSHSAVIPNQAVGLDGSITVPYAGRIHVAGKTPQQVERIIVERLVGKAIEPQALVTISSNVSSTVSVTGEVTSGAKVPISTRGDRILDVIAAAGGIRAPVHESFIALSRGGSTVRVPMQVLLAHPKENIFVRPWDTITVLREPQTFTVFGATGRNAMINFDAIGITLEEAVAKSGGLLEGQADPQGVFVLRTEPVEIARLLNPHYPITAGAANANVIYQVNLKDAGTYFLARKFAVHNKDVMYIASAPVMQLYKAMQLFSTVAQPAVTGAFAIRAFN